MPGSRPPKEILSQGGKLLIRGNLVVIGIEGKLLSVGHVGGKRWDGTVFLLVGWGKMEDTKMDILTQKKRKSPKPSQTYLIGYAFLFGDEIDKNPKPI